MKILILITAYSLAFLCLGCKTIDERDSQRQHKQFKIIGLYKDMFRGSILFACDDIQHEKYLVLSDTGCIDKTSIGRKLLQLNDTIEITIHSRPKPVVEDFINNSTFHLQRKTSLFLISFDTTSFDTTKWNDINDFKIVSPIAIRSKDSIVPNFYYSPDICGQYLMKK